MFDFEGILELLSTAAGAYGKYEAGQEAKREARDRAATADENARLDRERAADANRRASLEAEKQSQKTRALVGRQKAAMGASGVAVGEGSFADVLSETEEIGQEDEETIMLNGMREAYGYTQRAQDLTRQAKSYRSAGRAAGKAGLIGGMGSLIAGTYDTGTKRGWWQ